MRTIFIIIALMVIDFITGIIWSAVKTRKKFFSFEWLSSEKAIKGFLKKSAVLMTLFAFWMIDKTGIINVALYPLLLSYAGINETISILENLKKANSDYKNFKLEGVDKNERN